MATLASPPSLALIRVSSASSITHGGTAGRSRLFMGAPRPSVVLLRSSPLRPSAVAFARRRKNSSATTKTETSEREIKNDDGEGDDIDEDAFEALFSQLEEDLKNDNLSDDADDEITEEDLARLEQELAEAIGDGVDDDDSGTSAISSEDLDTDDETDEEERRPKLKNWQLRRLARALKIGRRKTSIKSLAAELGLDRAYVLELLRDPPPNLLLLSASLPDEIPQTHSQLDREPLESPQMSVSVAESKPEVKPPIHVMQTRWSAQKRLKKVQVETLERVYSRTKRPTNAMISSIVHVTNLPWKTVVKWFEGKRLQDGVPEHRVPFQRSMHETISHS